MNNLAKKKIKKNMKNKKLILEWENTEIKDGTTTYEKFKVI